MATHIHPFKRTVTAFVLTFALTAPLAAQETGLDALFQELIAADEDSHERIAERITGAFGKSGSATMDLLLRRGNDALEAGEPDAAVEHFTALVDHAPDFAEGYHSRASAYYSVGLIGPALDDLRQALVLNPRHFQAMFGVGILMEELGRDDEARAAFAAVLEVYPLDPQATSAISRLDLAQMGQAI